MFEKEYMVTIKVVDEKDIEEFKKCKLSERIDSSKLDTIRPGKTICFGISDWDLSFDLDSIKEVLKHGLPVILQKFDF